MASAHELLIDDVETDVPENGQTDSSQDDVRLEDDQTPERFQTSPQLCEEVEGEVDQTSPDLKNDLNLYQISVVHFSVGNNSKSEIALVPKNSTSDDIKGILMEQVGIDFHSLNERVSSLETILKSRESPCESIQELKEEVNLLKNKLESYEHLSWLGFYKALHPHPIPRPKDPPKSQINLNHETRGVGYHKKSREEKQLICDKFIKSSDVVLTKETCQLLREPTFDNWQWEDEEMLVLLQQMYLDLELPSKFDIEINILRNFLVSVYHNYNDVPFHNFRHCFCVTQMMYGLVSYVNLSEKVGDLETLILLTSCICHDLDHPGYNNIYQINAQTELALRYNDISPLENHHCSIAFRILENPETNIFRNFPVDVYKRVREGIIRCILATDMARHNEIVNQFREIVPYFNPTNRAHTNLLSMVLIKVADISNEARPMEVAEPWLDCLLAEFFQQSDTEKLEGLPVTPFMDREKITKPSSQCSFIGLVLLPLFEALTSLYKELEPLIIHPVRFALEYYRQLNEALNPLATSRHRKSTDVGLQPAALVSSAQMGNQVTLSDSKSEPISAVKSFKLKSRQFRANSLSISTELPLNHSMGFHNRRASHQATHLPLSSSFSSIKSGQKEGLDIPLIGSGGESGSLSSYSEDGEDDEDEDAITEVAVSERALKFKIATESSFDFSSSRKGSRENNKSEGSGHSHQLVESLASSSYALTPKVEILPPPNSDSFDDPQPSTSQQSEGTSSGKIKKESFFARLKLFTERLSLSADSTSGGSEGGSPPVGSSHFSYFRRSGRKHKAKGNRTSVSDSECQSGKMKSGSACGSAGPSPALGAGPLEDEVKGWKQCSGSLDSILSKSDDQGHSQKSRSPGRRFRLPRFSSFVQKRTKGIAFMRRSPKNSGQPES